MIPRHQRALQILLPCLLCALASAGCHALMHFDAMDSSTTSTVIRPGELPCPGGFPTDLSVVNCSYTLHQRFADFFSSSLSDQAVLGAVVFGAGAQIMQSPGEWKRTWDGYGHRVGVRYTQGAAKGATEFIVGVLDREDPRHVSYRNDPALVKKQRSRLANASHGLTTDKDPYAQLPPSAWKRIGHAFLDSITDRRSSADPSVRRIPAFSRFAGAFASGYGGYAWYAQPENTFQNAGFRAAQSFGTDVMSSLYTEFSPDLTKLLGAVLQRGRQKQ